MNEFDCINIFYNMIYGQDTAFMRDVFETYEHFCIFREWLFHHDIYMPSFNIIDQTIFAVAKSFSSVNDVRHVLHGDIRQEIQELRRKYEHMTHIIMFPGVNQDPFPSFSLDDKKVMVHQITDSIDELHLVIDDPFPGCYDALLNIDKWPGALIFTKDQSTFYPIRSLEDIEKLKRLMTSDQLYKNKGTHSSYYLHLSDLHLGPAKKSKQLEALYDSLNILMPYLHSDHKIKTIITGDLMNSPSKKNMYKANDFMTSLKKRYHADVTFVLGNHDMIVHGVNIGGGQKSKVIAYLLGDKLKILEDDKIILIKIDSNSQGSLARGAVGSRQLYEIEEELSTVEHLEQYTLVVMLHHHVYKVGKADFLKVAFKEKAILGKLLDSSKALIDAPIFINWLKRQNIRYVLHGHKHIPFFMEKDHAYIISAGSATGGGLKEEKSKYLSYNLLKYDYINHKMSVCFIFYIDRLKTNRSRVEIYMMEDEKHV